MSLAHCLEELIEKKSFTADEMTTVAKEMLCSDEVQMAAFLTLLRAKKETVDEIVGFVRALKEMAKPAVYGRSFVDIVGTGGDQAMTVNISTGSSLLTALCGIPVVKHGNRSVSSLSGSADVLEALGFDIHTPIDPLSLFNFCFAPDYHPALQKVRAVRRSLKIPTVFNLLGPLLNPAGSDHLQIGVYREDLVEVMAEALFRLGTKRSLVFHSHGLDELSCIGSTRALLVTDQKIEPFYIDPEALGLKKCTLEDLKGGDAKVNAEKLRAIFRGEDSPIVDTLILNAAVAQVLYGSAKSLEEGILKARQKLKVKSLKKALLATRYPIIAEIKRASPSKGQIGEIQDPVARANLYTKGGAAAISVLTDPAFRGSLTDLQAIAKVSSIPVLRKGFFLNKTDILMTRLNGADALLLIVSKIGEKTKEMIDEVKRIGLEALVEVHTVDELEIALAAGAEIIGVNQRDLKDFSMHPQVYEQLIDQIPKMVIRVAESGIQCKKDAENVRRLGYEVILIGEALTRSDNPIEFLQSLRGYDVG